MRTLILIAALVVENVLGVATAKAGGDGAYFELDGPNGFYGSPGVPPDAFKQLKEAQKTKAKLKCVAFTPDGDWVELFGQNGVWTSNGNLPAVKKFSELWKDPKADFKCVAFAPGGGWTIFWGQNGSWSDGIPEAALQKITEVGKSGGTLRSIAYAPNGGWVLLFDKSGVYYGGIADDLAKVLNNAVQARAKVECVAFSPGGEWVCLTNNGWWTSNVGMPASKFIAANLKRGYSPKWLAFVPGDNGQGPFRLETKPARHVVATLTTDIALPNAKVDEWYLYAPVVPKLPGQEKVTTTFTPPGAEVREGSALKRPLYLTRLTDGRKEVHAVLIIDATLMSRHLRPLRPGETLASVKELSPEHFKIYTSASPTIAYASKVFQDWEHRADLVRKDGEADMDYAHRAFAYVKHHYTYQWPTPARTASATCRAGQSDCEGLSAVFVSLMRANGIPARLLCGRWAQSQVKDEGQDHVKSEFFAAGLGWVPVDASGAVGDTHGGDFAFFGNDPGDFVTLSVGEDQSVNSFVDGKQNIGFLQGLLYWWRGSGGDKGSRFVENWVVEKR